MRTSQPRRRSAIRFAMPGILALLVACAERERSIPSPPIPADLAAFDPEITELIRGEVESLALDLGNSDQWRELGMLYHAHDQIELATECYRQSVALAPYDARALFYLALAQQRSGRTQEAIAAMRRVTEIDASYVPARWRLGLWLLEEGQVPAALEILQAALAQARDDPFVHHALARAYLQAGTPGDAAALLKGWLEEHPDDPYGRFLLGTAYRRLGRADDAQRELLLGRGAQPSWSDPWSDRVEAKRVGFSARLATATELLDADPPHAVERLERLRHERPENATVLINLGIGYRRLQRLEASAEALREAVRLEPARGLAHFHLALTFSEIGARDQSPETAAQSTALALEHAERAVELQPTSAKNHAMYGELLARTGRTEAAVAAYRRAVEDPQDPAWLHRLGGLLCQLGRWAEAVPVLEDCLGRVGDDPDVLFLLGAAQANSGDSEAARRSLQRALRARPGDPRARGALEQLESSKRRDSKEEDS